MIVYKDGIDSKVIEHGRQLHDILNLHNWKIIVEVISLGEKHENVEYLENVGQNIYIFDYLESNIKLDTARSLEFQKETLTHELLHLVFASIETHVKYRIIDKIKNNVLFEDAHNIIAEEIEHLVVIWTRILSDKLL